MLDMKKTVNKILSKDIYSKKNLSKQQVKEEVENVKKQIQNNKPIVIHKHIYNPILDLISKKVYDKPFKSLTDEEKKKAEELLLNKTYEMMRK